MSRKERLALERRLRAAVSGAPFQFSVEDARRNWYANAEAFSFPPQLRVDVDELAGRPCEWVRRPAASESRALLYLHGGGFVCGSIASHRPLVAELAKSFEGGVASLDYRLAPEHPYPAAVDDTVAAVEALLARGFAAHEIALAGDSAGAGLVLATLVALRDAGRPRPAAALFISPWFDLAARGASLRDNAARDYLVFPAALEGSGSLYRADLAADDPRVSPLYADLRGLPPLCIQVGSGEVLLDDALRLARAAALVDVEVTLEIWSQLPHVWHLFAAELGEARAASARAARWLNERDRSDRDS
jgi:acetyl esterase/lipase